MDQQTIHDLIASRRERHSLTRPFYRDERIYQAELDRIWRQGWLFAGHSCQIPEAGDFFTMQLDTDPVVIVRDQKLEVNAFHNLCRHRGTIICKNPTGQMRRFVCPYHQWTYGLQGELLSCRGMQDDLDKQELGLFRLSVRELVGMIFVSFADDPPDFEPAANLIGSYAKPQGLDNAKVAKMLDYEINANWKIVWENNRECYHCNVNHPQYIKANFDHFNEDDTSERIQQKISANVARSESKWAEAGLAATHRQAGIASFPNAEHNLWYSANRTVLADGYVTESMNGQQVAPLMGDYQEADVGTLRIRTVPNMWNHSSCDHAVTTRLLPAGPNRTLARVIWLVDANAVERRDYRLEELMPFWQLTSEQDWELCEQAQRGVNSNYYQPGPFSTFKEYNLESFVRWYLGQLSVES